MCTYILLKLIYFYFICNGILPSCYVHVPTVPLEARRRHQILGNEVTDSCEHGAEN